MNSKKQAERTESETEFMPLSQAAELTGYTPEYLNLLSRQKKIKAKKIGRNWHTKKSWLNEFLAKTAGVLVSGAEAVKGQKAMDDKKIEKVEKVENIEIEKVETEAPMETPREESAGVVSQDGKWLKILAVMSSAIIILPLIFAGTRVMKIVVVNSRKNTELAKIYSENQDTLNIISNENTDAVGQVAGISTTQPGGNVILASANFKINSINVGGNMMVLSNENNQPLEIKNIKSDSFADNKKNETSLVVAWQTNKMSMSDLEYAKSGGQNPTGLKEDSYGFNHSAVISGLEPGASYVFQIKARDRWANEVDSDFFGVYTASKPVSVFDLISNAVGEVFGWAIKK